MADYIVTTLDDETFEGTETTGTPDGNGLSLREALGLALANGATTADTITFDASLTGGATSGVNDGVITLGGTQLTISSDVTIDGDTDGDDKADVTIDADGNSRVFGISDRTSTLDALTITGGSDSFGGGIFVNDSANLTVVRSTVTGNAATSSNGGGISSTGTLTLVNSTISGNSSMISGGGIASTGATTLTNVTLAGNVADWNGGGIDHDGGSLTLLNSTLSGNKAGYRGGGLYTKFTAMTIANSVLLANYAVHSGLEKFVFFNTGTPPNYSGVNLIDFGLDDDPSDGVINAVDLNSVFATVGLNPHTAVTSGLLADNGGAVETIALNLGAANPALEAGDASALDESVAGDLNGDGDTNDTITTDARGFDRDVDFDGVGGTPDLGAFEAQRSDPMVVTTLSDSGDDATVTGDLAAEAADGGGLSLREALILANTMDGADTISFDGALTGGSDPGVDDGVVTLGGSQLVITSDVTIDGDTDGDATADITIDADGGSRVFNVTAGASTLGALTITGGYADSDLGGGGVRIDTLASLIVVNTTLAENTTATGVYIGGGVLNNGTLTMLNSTLSGNSGDYAGGGLANYGTATLTNVTLAGNDSATGSGGGIANFNPGQLTMTNSTLSGNIADELGGGLWSGGTAATIVNTAIAGNHAGTAGPDIYTISGATTTYSGVNLFSQVGAGVAGADIVEADLTNIFASVGANPDTGVTSGDLADNGGPVGTILILRGGVAQNAGSNAALPPDLNDLDKDGVQTETLPVDARGENRVSNTTVDIGAVELTNVTPVAEDDAFATDEATVVNGAASVMADNGNGIDDDPDGDTLTVTMVNGIGFIPGVAFALPSGALLTMNSDGTFTYDPNGVFDALPVGIVDQDTFTYTIDDGDSGTDNATATIEITGLDSDDTFVGTPGVDVFSGGVGNDTMTGLAGKDKLNGDGGKDTIDGGNDDDKLDGGGGKDVLNGGKGNDKLTGGGKSDTFVFNTKLNKKKNVDKVKDFKVNKDTIGLDEDIFKKVGSKLSKKEFEIGSKADDKSDRIIYDKKTGDLSYDKNGSKSGGKTLFAELDKGLKLDHKDFAVGDFVL